MAQGPTKVPMAKKIARNVLLGLRLRKMSPMPRESRSVHACLGMEGMQVTQMWAARPVARVPTKVASAMNIAGNALLGLRLRMKSHYYL